MNYLIVHVLCTLRNLKLPRKQSQKAILKTAHQSHLLSKLKTINTYDITECFTNP